MPAEVERSRSSSVSPTAIHPHHDHARNTHHKEALRLALGSILAPKRPCTSLSRPASGSATPVYPAVIPTESLLSRPLDSSHLHPRPSPHPHSHSHSHLHHAHHPSPPSRLGRPELNTPPGMTPSFPQPHYFFTHPHTTTSSPAPYGLESGTATPATSSAPASAANSPPITHSPGPAAGHSPILAPEEEHLQLLPPIVAAGSKPTAEVFPTAVPRPVQAVPLDADAKIEHNRDPARGDKSPHIDKSHHPHENGGALTPRAKLLETLQTKNTAWDALIHGSFS